MLATYKALYSQKIAASQIYIGERLFSTPLFFEYCSQLGNYFAIVSDSHVASIHATQLVDQLRQWGLRANLFVFPFGEENKTRKTKEMLEDLMLEKGMGKDSCLIAVGGGVVTDLGGFLAATYCRGIPWIAIPTTLLGMVDASIGGKTAVNTSHAKNMIGSIHHPKAVFMDLDFLQTLPVREFRSGFAEMIKHGLIESEEHFDFLASCKEKLFNRDPLFLGKAILDSCKIKLSIVEQDDLEQGKRVLLNFGHTIGHAFEKLSHYQLLHGEAIAMGILVESYLALQMNCLDFDSFKKILKILKYYQLPIKLSFSCDPEQVFSAAALDKKSVQNIPRFVILNGIGKVLKNEGAYCQHVDHQLLTLALKKFLA